MNQHSERERIREAYLLMAKAGYRPAAPGDGVGGISLTRSQLADPTRLETEARVYADSFIKEENECRFWIGCADSKRTQALVYAIEASRLLCGMDSAVPFAGKLLRLALGEIESRKPEAR